MIVKYKRRALADLFEIHVYTRARWGEEQADRYRDLLIDGCESILPSRIHRAKSIATRNGVQAWHVVSHVIYFRRTEDSIVILRILHQRMLPETYLNEV